MKQKNKKLVKQSAAWSVHIFTATGAVFGLLTLNAIHNSDFIMAFWFMAAAIIVDSIDGTFARMVDIKTTVQKIDGALLDNLIDFINYVTVPAFFVLVSDLVPYGWRYFAASIIIYVSAYQFSQYDAKTDDHFFKGFPSYWNIVIFYLYFWQYSTVINLIIIAILSLLVFVPVKYVYPTRLEYLSKNGAIRKLMLFSTILWGAATLSMLWHYPEVEKIGLIFSVAYVVAYFLISFYRTWRPIEMERIDFEEI